jgi:hypothetical protein
MYIDVYVYICPYIYIYIDGLLPWQAAAQACRRSELAHTHTTLYTHACAGSSPRLVSMARALGSSLAGVTRRAPAQARYRRRLEARVVADAGRCTPRRGQAHTQNRRAPRASSSLGPRARTAVAGGGGALLWPPAAVPKPPPSRLLREVPAAQDRRALRLGPTAAPAVRRCRLPEQAGLLPP